MPWNYESMAIPVQSCNSVAIAVRDRPPASPSSIYPGGLVELSRGDCGEIVDCMGLRRYCNPVLVARLAWSFSCCGEGGEGDLPYGVQAVLT